MKIRIGNYWVMIDREDAWRVEQYRYYARERRGYVFFQRYIVRGGKLKTPMLHREIMECPKNLVTDHIDGNQFDCRKKNLRNCTKRQNSQNRKGASGSVSGLKGVGYHAAAGKWQAVINVNGNPQYIGLFETPKQAHKAYCARAVEAFGEFARFA